MKRFLILTLVLLAFASPALAYKEQIHRVISLKAWDRVTADLKSRAGMDAMTDLGGATARVLVGQGAYDEDAVPNPLSHFYNPAHEAPLTIPLENEPIPYCLPVGSTAKSRAVAGVGNEFSTWAARQYLRASLLAPNNTAKMLYRRQLFLAIGHSIHLLQDMAQPEHTRNDQHLTMAGIEFGDAAEASIWEEWGLSNLLGVNPAVSYDGYPNVKLPRANDYFSNAGGQGLAQFSNRNFVTQDTNYGDERALGRCMYHSAPDINLAAERIQKGVAEAVLRADYTCCDIVVVDERIYTSFVNDAYLPAAGSADQFHTFLSSVDLETRRYFGTGLDYGTGLEVYSLGEPSYLTRASMLIPRAVGYSAGYIDHFFRGTIEATWTPSVSGKWNIIVKNTSGEPVGADALIDVVYAPGAAYLGVSGDVAFLLQGSIASYIPGFAGLPPGSSVTFNDVSVPYLRAGDDVTQFERRIIIRGTLGSEPEDIMTLVQPGQKKAPLRVVWTWENNESLTCRAFDDGHAHYAVSSAYPEGAYPAGHPNEVFYQTNIPNASISPAPRGGYGPVTMTISSIPPGGLTLHFDYSHLNSYRDHTPVDTTATVKVYLNDVLVWQSTKPVSTFFLTSFGTYSTP